MWSQNISEMSNYKCVVEVGKCILYVHCDSNVGFGEWRCYLKCYWSLNWILLRLILLITPMIFPSTAAIDWLLLQLFCWQFPKIDYYVDIYRTGASLISLVRIAVFKGSPPPWSIHYRTNQALSSICIREITLLTSQDQSFKVIYHD